MDAHLQPRMSLHHHCGRALALAVLALSSTAALALEPAATIDPAYATPLDAVIDGLAPGDFRWTPELAPQGPMVIVVSLPQQRAHVYRNGVRIGLSTISSGKPGNETPTGVFTILQKKRMHRSNLYNDAPMPFMQRLTWDGIALHAGRIPGQPASHGCVRLPLAFAELLFEATERDMTVVIADEAAYDASVVWPGDQVPVNYITGLSLQAPSAAPSDGGQSPATRSPSTDPREREATLAVHDRAPRRGKFSLVKKLCAYPRAHVALSHCLDPRRRGDARFVLGAGDATDHGARHHGARIDPDRGTGAVRA